MTENKKLLEFRLHSEGSNKYPCWGIAFRHKEDIPLAVDTGNRPTKIKIEFPDMKIYTFGIRDSFWKGCYEFVDAQVEEGTKPIKSLAIDRLGYKIETKNECKIEVVVSKHNQLLSIVTFE